MGKCVGATLCFTPTADGSAPSTRVCSIYPPGGTGKVSVQDGSAKCGQILEATFVGGQACRRGPIVESAAAAMLRQVARACPNVRPSPGDAGQMQMKLFNGAFPVFLSEDGGDWENFPVAKKVMFDGFAGVAPGVAGPRRNEYGNAYN